MRRTTAYGTTDERNAQSGFVLNIKGLRNAEIGPQLGLKERSVKGDVRQLLLIFDVTNRTKLIGLVADRSPEWAPESTGEAHVTAKSVRMIKRATPPSTLLFPIDAIFAHSSESGLDFNSHQGQESRC